MNSLISLKKISKSFHVNKKLVVLRENFFNQTYAVVFRSFTEIFKFIGKKNYPVRGKKIDRIIQLIKSNTSLKITLGGCIVKKVNQTVIISKEC